jgi:hypothetical protein
MVPSACRAATKVFSVNPFTANSRISRGFTQQTGTVYAAFTMNHTNFDSNNFFWFALSDEGDDDNSAGIAFRSGAIFFRIRPTGTTTNSSGSVTYTTDTSARIVFKSVESFQHELQQPEPLGEPLVLDRTGHFHRHPNSEHGG